MHTPFTAMCAFCIYSVFCDLSLTRIIKLTAPTITVVLIIHGIIIIEETSDIFSINASLPNRVINIIPPQLLFIIWQKEAG